MTVLVMLVLFGFAAIAVDGGLLQNRRRDAQNAADSAAMAAAWASCHNQDSVAAGLASASDNGFSNDGTSSVVTVTDLGNHSAEVVIAATDDAQFSKAIGNEQLTVGASAKARCLLQRGLRALPFGAVPGGSDGGLQVLNPCSSGNCRRIMVDRLDGANGSEALLANMSFGVDRILQPSWGPTDPRVPCSGTTSTVCNIVITDTGVSSGNISPGLEGRLLDVSNATRTVAVGSQLFNADTMEDVLGTAPVLLSSVGQPPDWNPALHGTWGAGDISSFYWYNGVIAKCDSPRLASLPIITPDLEFDPSTWVPADGYPGWPSGSKDAKVLGHYLIYISFDAALLTDNVKEVPAKIIWLGPGAACANGDRLSDIGMGEVIRQLSLLE